MRGAGRRCNEEWPSNSVGVNFRLARSTFRSMLGAMHAEPANPLADRTALLVDDEAYFRRFASEVLKKGGVERVIEARDGRDAVRLFPQQPIDIVLLDISMPHLDGLKTLMALRAMSPAVPIIMLTSVAEEKVVEECVGHGATFFIRKDVPAHELTPALLEVLRDYLQESGSAP